MSSCCGTDYNAMQTECDPVCGREVNRVTASRAEHEGRDYFFCSERCQRQFSNLPGEVLANHHRHLATRSASVIGRVARWARDLKRMQRSLWQKA